ncbi:alpha/beta fold hydrolase [Aquimarina algiphila]|uniref:alpha/beta fold hydrolase n=1 Tax=Aquimarina algiphila TaxID=2047982 RepID=UPI00232FD6BA|nr:alpha/beta fold hydrolase [Aquimarina algiphila]
MKIKVLDEILIRHNEIDKNKQSIWCIHAFADSGLAYKEIFSSNLASNFNIYVADLPGFGVSPLNSSYLSIKEHSNFLSKIILKENKKQKKVNIVAHSLGGLIGTWVCQQLKDQINYYFNIEGNLTEADSYFSSKPLRYGTAEEFAKMFEEEIFEKAKKKEAYRRYYSSLRFAEPDGMRNWGFSSQEHIKNDKCGFEFKKLTCKKVYIWGNIDTPKETQEFIKEHNLTNRFYKEVGHWHMIENPETLYNDMNEILKTV